MGLQSTQGWFWRSLLGLVVLIGVWGGWLSPAGGDSLALPIAQARRQPDGQAVVISGRVTVPSGLFQSANLDEGFALQDATGGIYVSSDRRLPLTLGERVQVTGTVQGDGHGQRQVRLQTWQRRDRPLAPIAPRPASAQAAGRDLDGQLVTVTGVISRPLKEDAPYGDRLWLRDATGEIQIYLPKSTAIAPQDWLPLQPGQIVQVTGLSSQFDATDEVIPRTRADFHFLPPGHVLPPPAPTSLY